MNLADLYAQKAVSLRRFLLRHTKNAADAADVAQDAFLRVHQNQGNLRDPDRALYQIARNRLIDLKRTQKSHLSYEKWVLEQPPKQPDDPHKLLENKELWEAFNSALDKLLDIHRRAFVLHALDGLSIEETAEAMHVCRGTALSRVFYARQKLRHLLKHMNPNAVHSVS